MSDWKKHHADESGKAVDHELVQDVMKEFAENMRFDLDGLPAYGLAKVAFYAAQVARAQALGFDPDLLRLSEDEANESLLRVAEAAALAGKPVWVIELSEANNE